MNRSIGLVRYCSYSFGLISENDFAKIEAKMMELAKKNEPVVRKEVSKADALAEFKADGHNQKVRLSCTVSDRCRLSCL